jgi:HAD superfamily hydrolase (TIGR01509 family)
VERLDEALHARGIERSLEDVARAFRAEVDYYSAHKIEGRDAESLARLRADCARVFVDALGAELDFTDDFTAAIVFRPLPGALAAIASFRAQGLSLAVVSNWDCSLGEHLDEAGIRVDSVVTCAEVGVAKPDPRPLLVALERLHVEPARTLHIGDHEADEQAAAAAGTQFRRFESWTT